MESLGPGRETDMAQHRTRQVGALHPAVQYDGLFAVLGKEGDGRCPGMTRFSVFIVMLRTSSAGAK